MLLVLLVASFLLCHCDDIIAEEGEHMKWRVSKSCHCDPMSYKIQVTVTSEQSGIGHVNENKV